MIRLENLLKTGSGGTLEEIVQRAQDMGELTQVLRDGLDPSLAAGLLSANVRDDACLVLVCASSAWAARLRFESEALMALARRAGANVRSCRVTVSQRR